MNDLAGWLAEYRSCMPLSIATDDVDDDDADDDGDDDDGDG